MTNKNNKYQHMKIKNLVIATSLIFSVSTFAQKEELKTADKAFKEGNSAEAKAVLLQVEHKIVNATDDQKAQFYFLKGSALFDLAKKKIETGTNLVEAAKAYNELIEAENISGIYKYSTLARSSLIEVKNELFNGALEDDKVKNYKESALKLYQVYQLDKRDSIMLYYAAGTALNAQDYDLALGYYNKLKDINYSGKGQSYLAMNKLNDKEDVFGSLKERDDAVKLGSHANPRTEAVPSKRGDIYKYIAQIYIQKGDVAAAKKSVSDARRLNPGDNSLLIAEAELYLKTNDIEMYKKLISQAIVNNPNDADLFYNLGVISGQSKDANAKAEAEKNYLKAIQINPQYKNAYMNLAVLKLSDDTELLNQMNKITGTSAADNKKYDALKAKRLAMFKSALPYLEKAQELFADDKDVKTTLLNVYNALDMTDKYNALKAKK